MSLIVVSENKTSTKTILFTLGIPVILGVVSPSSIIIKGLFAFVSLFAVTLLASLSVMAYIDYKNDVVRKKPTTWGDFSLYVSVYYLGMITMCVYFKYAYLTIAWVLILVFTELIRCLVQVTFEVE